MMFLLILFPSCFAVCAHNLSPINRIAIVLSPPAGVPNFSTPRLAGGGGADLVRHGRVGDLVSHDTASLAVLVAALVISSSDRIGAHPVVAYRCCQDIPPSPPEALSNTAEEATAAAAPAPAPEAVAEAAAPTTGAGPTTEAAVGKTLITYRPVKSGQAE